MSCWRNYKCDVLKNIDEKRMGNALKEIGLGIDWNLKEVRAVYENRTESCDGVIIKDGSSVSLGLRIDPQTKVVTVVGDFWGTGINEKTFVNTLTSVYQKINLVHNLRMNGYEVSSIENKNGEIVIEAFAG